MQLNRPGELDKIPTADAQRLVQELRVHQIELEMQNQELHRIQQELETSHDKYFDLYDLAPVGYVTLNENGIILEANLTAAALLGKERSHPIGQHITSFINRQDQDIYYRHTKQLLKTLQHQECEVRMLKGDGTQFWAQLESVAAKGSKGVPAYRTAIIDITRRKQVEDELDRYRDHLSDLVRERTSELACANEEQFQSEERYRTLFNTMIEGFCVIEVIVDSSGRPVDYRYLETNPAFEAHTGLQNAQGRLMSELAPDHEVHWFEIYGKIVLTG